jgi:hypothetical protein
MLAFISTIEVVLRLFRPIVYASKRNVVSHVGIKMTHFQQTKLMKDKEQNFLLFLTLFCQYFLSNV